MNAQSGPPTGPPQVSTVKLVTLGLWVLAAIIINHWLMWLFVAPIVLFALVPTRTPQPAEPTSQQPRSPQIATRMSYNKPTPKALADAKPTIQQAADWLLKSLRHYDLSDWWAQTFTQAQQQEFLTRFHEITVSIDPNQTPSGTAHQFLVNTAQYFNRTDRVHLGVPMLKKALSYNLNPQDEYYTLSAYIQQRYKQRAEDPTAIDDVARACERTIELIPALHAYWKSQHTRAEARRRRLAQDLGEDFEPREWEGFPPTHVGFPRLIAIRKKQKNEAEVERLQQLYGDLWQKHSMYRRVS